MIRTKFPFRGIQFVNMECWKNEALRAKNQYIPGTLRLIATLVSALIGAISR
jgi:hypothetical protein